jgi:hypothetical protein
MATSTSPIRAAPSRPTTPNTIRGVDNDGDGLIDRADPACTDPEGDDESADPAIAQCRNGLDDDGDGLIDLADRGCASARDDDESDDPALPACSNALDDDDDGFTDYPADPGCGSVGDDDETNTGGPTLPQCGDGQDNDGDGRIDLADPGCSSVADPRESDPEVPPACFNGLDDDDDGVIDFPLEAGCSSAGDEDEADPDLPPACGNGLDDDGDGRVDYPDDPGCAQVPSEITIDRVPAGRWNLLFGPSSVNAADVTLDVEIRVLPPSALACGNGRDDDGDGRVDADDPGCIAEWDADEADDAQRPPACANGLDDDGDGLADADDPGCLYAGQLAEVESCPGFLPAAWIGQTGGSVTLLPFGTEFGDLPRHFFSCEISPAGVRQPLWLHLDVPSRVGVDRATTSTIEVTDGCGPHAQSFACTRERADIERLEPGDYLIYTVISLGVEVNVQVTPLDRACIDGADGDGDGLIDADDPGCEHAFDDDERDEEPAPACANGLDDDFDGLVDAADPACAYAGGQSEKLPCGADAVQLVPAGGGQIEVLPPIVASPIGGNRPGRTALRIPIERPSALVVHRDSPDINPEYSLTPDCTSVNASTPWPIRHRIEWPGMWNLIVYDEGSAPVTYDIELRPLDPLCADGIDNDGDGRVDADDPGCVDVTDDDEADPDPLPACANGLDDDDDGLIDFPDDQGCRAAGGIEDPQCAAGVPLVYAGQRRAIEPADWHPADGPVAVGCPLATTWRFTAIVEFDERSRIRVPTPIPGGGFVLTVHEICGADAHPISQRCIRSDLGVASAELPPGRYEVVVETDALEPPATELLLVPAAALAACRDGLDNDDDGLIDLADRGCADLDDTNEADPAAAPACSNGIDDDLDGLVDFPDDPLCFGPGDPFENAADCPARGTNLIAAGARRGRLLHPQRQPRRPAGRGGAPRPDPAPASHRPHGGCAV